MPYCLSFWRFLNRPLLLLVLSLELLAATASAQHREYFVAFDTGKTEISLQQVARLEAIAQQLTTDPDEKVVVHAYASDARPDDTNERLARRRSYLLQQCLERAGVPLPQLHIRHFTCGKDELCPIGARVWIERNAALQATNLYRTRNLAYVWSQCARDFEQTYTIRPDRDTFLRLRSTRQLWVPAGAFETTDTAAVRLRVRELRGTQAPWLHGLSNGQTAFDPYGVLHVEAEQRGRALPKALRRPLAELRAQDRLPDYATAPKWYQQGEWVAPAQVDQRIQHLAMGEEWAFAKDCSGAARPLEPPVYQTPPSPPQYTDPDSVVALQDVAIAQLSERLEALEAQRYDRRQRDQWTPQQKQRAYALQSQRAQLLVQREHLRRKALNDNARLEEAYYKTVAAYNRQRHQQQQGYLQQKKQAQTQEAQQAVACAQYAERQAYLERVYTIPQRLQLTAWTERHLGQYSAYQPMVTLFDHLSTLAAVTHPVPPLQAAPARLEIKTRPSAYKVTAYLMWGDQVVEGKAKDAQTLVFDYRPDPAQRVRWLWAVVEGPDGYETAVLEVPLDGDPPELSFSTLPFGQTTLFETDTEGSVESE